MNGPHGDESAADAGDSQVIALHEADDADDSKAGRDETAVEADDPDAAGGDDAESEAPPASQHLSLKHHLLGPSLTKAGQDSVDQKKVSEIIYEVSKGSKFFNNEEVRDQVLTTKIARILQLKARLAKLDLKADLRRADDYIASLELTRDLSQYVVHLDCDAFYAAVEEIDRPELKSVPMGVGQGVIVTCNYEARKYGVRSAMAGFVARKLCPQLICLPINFEKYTAKAREVRAILAEYDPRYESASMDEAYMNLTDYCTTHDIDAGDAVDQMRREIYEKCKITVSAGIGPNAKIAKICSNKNKPNGQFCVPNERAAILSFMNDLPVRKVNGVGRVLERELDAIGIQTCGQIYGQRAYLTRLFGDKTFQFLIQTYLGIGRTLTKPAEEYERKSVGTERTFRDISRPTELRERLRQTAEDLQKDMARVGVKGRTLVLKIKLHTYEVFTRQVVPPKAVWHADDLYQYALPMLVKLEKEMPNFKLRLMGLRCTQLVSTKHDDGTFFNSRRYLRSSGTTKLAPPPSSTSYGTEASTAQSEWSKRECERQGHVAREEEWESWPAAAYSGADDATANSTDVDVDFEFEEAARHERALELADLERLSQEHDAAEGADENDGADNVEDQPEWHAPFGRYKYGSASTTTSPAKRKSTSGGGKQGDDDDGFWDCPICAMPQVANDRDFNAHIDLCLSRGTIRDAVAQIEAEAETGGDTSCRRARLVRHEGEGESGSGSGTDSAGPGTPSVSSLLLLGRPREQNATREPVPLGRPRSANAKGTSGGHVSARAKRKAGAGSGKVSGSSSRRGESTIAPTQKPAPPVLGADDCGGEGEGRRTKQKRLFFT